MSRSSNIKSEKWEQKIFNFQLYESSLSKNYEVKNWRKEELWFWKSAVYFLFNEKNQSAPTPWIKIFKKIRQWKDAIMLVLFVCISTNLLFSKVRKNYAQSVLFRMNLKKEKKTLDSVQASCRLKQNKRFIFFKILLIHLIRSLLDLTFD